MPVISLGIEVDDSGAVQRIDQFTGSIDDLANTVRRQTQTLSSRFANLARGVGRNFVELAQKTAKWAAALGTLAGTAALGATIIGAAKFEQAMLGVQKTTGESTEIIEELRVEFLELSKVIPVTAIELGKIGEVAGQLGIKGKQDIAIFTETIAKIATVTAFTADEAALALAKISGLFGVPISKVEKLASALNELENNTTANVPAISEFLRRLAPASTLIGLTAADTAGLSATLIDLGLNAELASTAVSATLTDMQTDGEAFAEQMGISIGEFRESLERDAIGTIIKWGESIQDLPADQFIKQLRDVGINGSRALQVFTKLTKNTERLSRNVNIANKGFEEGTSIQREFDVFASSLSNQFVVLVNRIKAVAFEVGNEFLPLLKDLVSDLGDTLIPILRDVGRAFVDLAPFILRITKGLFSFIDAVGDFFRLGGMARRLAADKDELENLNDSMVLAKNRLNELIESRKKAADEKNSIAAKTENVRIIQQIKDITTLQGRINQLNDSRKKAAKDLEDIGKNQKKLNDETNRGIFLTEEAEKIRAAALKRIDQLTLDSFDLRIIAADEMFQTILKNVKDEKLANQLLDAELADILKERDEREDKLNKKRIRDATTSANKEKKIVDDFNRFHDKAVLSRFDFERKQIVDTFKLFSKVEGIDKIKLAKATNFALAKIDVAEFESFEKNKKKELETTITTEDLKKQAVIGVADSLKSIFMNTSMTFDDVWKRSLSLFIDIMGQMVAQAIVAGKAIQVEMAAATAGISLVIGAIGLAFSGSRAGGATLKSLPERIKDVLNSFVKEFADTLKDFRFSLLTTEEKIAFLGDEISNSGQKIFDASKEITKLKDFLKQLPLGFPKGRREAEEAIIEQQNIIKKNLLEVTGLILKRFTEEKRFIEDRFNTEKRLIEEKHNKEKELVLDIGRTIEDLRNQQKSFAADIESTITEVKRRGLAPEELLKEFQSDVKSIQKELVGAEGESKVGLLQDLKGAQLEVLRQTETIFGLGSKEFKDAQAETITILEGIQKDGVSEFEQMITVQQDQLRELTGQTEAMAALQVINERMADSLEVITTQRDVAIDALNTRTISALEAILSIGKGEDVPGNINTLADIIQFIKNNPIPVFDNGGITTKPTLGILSKNGEPEMVIPLNKNRKVEVENVGGSQNQPAIVNVNMDGKVLMDLFLEWTRDGRLKFDSNSTFDPSFVGADI